MQAEVREAFARRLLELLEVVCPGSRAELRGSLSLARCDLYSDIDLRWIVPDERFTAALTALPGVLNDAGPVEALRLDPELQRSDRRRMVFVCYAHLPLFWRVDLDIRARSIGADQHYDERNPAARGDDWSLPASALANAVAAIKAVKRGQADRAHALLDRAYARLDDRRRTTDWTSAIVELAERAATLEPAQTMMANRVIDLARAEPIAPDS